MNAIELGEKINTAGREFKSWFMDFTLVYTPIFVLVGLLMTGTNTYLNGRLATSLWFMVPWALVQVLAVDGLWFAVWIRILTDEYRWGWFIYHFFLILVGFTMTGIGIVMADILFFQEALGITSSLAAMQVIGLPLGIFLHSRAVLLMATATLAIILDKRMRSKPRFSASTVRKSSPKPEPATVVIPADKPVVLALPEPAKPNGYREAIKSTMARFMAEGKSYTYKDLAAETGASLQTVKVHAPKIKQELAEKE